MVDWPWFQLCRDTSWSEKVFPPVSSGWAWVISHILWPKLSGEAWWCGFGHHVLCHGCRGTGKTWQLILFGWLMGLELLMIDYLWGIWTQATRKCFSWWCWLLPSGHTWFHYGLASGIRWFQTHQGTLFCLVVPGLPPGMYCIAARLWRGHWLAGSLCDLACLELCRHGFVTPSMPWDFWAATPFSDKPM